VHVTLVKGHVAVTPLTLDMTAPVDMGKMEALLKA
jgi:hypothetical protein